MTENNDNLFQLRYELDELSKIHQAFSAEIDELRMKINQSIATQLNEKTPESQKNIQDKPENLYEIVSHEVKKEIIIPEQESPISEKVEVKEPEMVLIKEEVLPDVIQKINKSTEKKPVSSYKTIQDRIREEERASNKDFKGNSAINATGFNFEKYVGENLITIIGVVILLIGMAVGVKYSIDNNLIDPKTRVGLGYLMSVGLLSFGIWFKKKYENYSAILVSGSIASLYFITYFAYSFYKMMDQGVAFALMVIFTIFAVIAAINYNRQVIAHIGLVGAYAVPFLLSNKSGQVAILFSYMAVINSGILILAIKKYWKPLYYTSFFLTWIIFLSMYGSQYKINVHFELYLFFLFLFFAIFYTVLITYKLIKKEVFNRGDISLLMLNSCLFFGIGYSILDEHHFGKQLLGLYAVLNAAIHFIVSILIYRQKDSDRNLFYIVIGLVLTFLTIAVPIQLDGRYVTLMWAGESALLFWIGRTKNVGFYEKMSYIIMAVASISLIHDWQTVYDVYSVANPESKITPIFNINFLTSLLFIGSFVFTNILFFSSKYSSNSKQIEFLKPLINICLPTILAVAIYFAFYLEIACYWDQIYLDSTNNKDTLSFKWIWLINYSITIFSILSFANIKKFKNINLGVLAIILNSFALFIFLTFGQYFFTELRNSYIKSLNANHLTSGSDNLLIRYFSYLFVLLTYFSIYRQIIQEYLKPLITNLKIFFDFFVAISLLWLFSSELIACMDIFSPAQPYKLGLSILWGIFALVVISYGLWRRKKHLRVGAMVLFAITIIKVFFYDLAELNTISKTIVLVSLGILLLISSFLYNKFKNLIGEENEIKPEK